MALLCCQTGELLFGEKEEAGYCQQKVLNSGNPEIQSTYLLQDICKLAEDLLGKALECGNTAIEEKPRLMDPFTQGTDPAALPSLFLRFFSLLLWG